MPHVGKTADRQTQSPPRPATPEQSTSSPPLMNEEQIDGSMHTEEPDGWDQAPQDIKDPEQKRHPRPDGVGGIEPAKDKKHE